jgi:hypothetical protein
MGITVALETEDGSRQAVVEDPTNVLHRVLPDAEDHAFQWAGTIDWYGNTTFNSLQAQALRKEWSRLIAAAEQPADAVLLRRIDDLLVRAADGLHLYVKFYGD